MSNIGGSWATRAGTRAGSTAVTLTRMARGEGGTRTGVPARRQQILEVSGDLFARRGYQSVSIYDIGAALGLSGAALYRHFPNKDAILVELIVSHSERLLALGRDIVASTSGNPLEPLVAAYVVNALANQASIKVYLRDFQSLPDEDREKARRVQRAYVDLWVDAFCDRWPAVPRRRARSAVLAAFGLMNSTPYSADFSLPVSRAKELLHGLAMAAFEAAAAS